MADLNAEVKGRNSRHEQRNCRGSFFAEKSCKGTSENGVLFERTFKRMIYQRRMKEIIELQITETRTQERSWSFRSERSHDENKKRKHKVYSLCSLSESSHDVISIPWSALKSSTRRGFFLWQGINVIPSSCKEEQPEVSLSLSTSLDSSCHPDFFDVTCSGFLFIIFSQVTCSSHSTGNLFLPSKASGRR